jgi:hypothetical protein
MSTRWKNVALTLASTPLSAQIAKPESDRENTVIPAHFIVRMCPARVAQGARKSRLANRGDAPTMTHAARDTKTLARKANHNQIRAIAARGWR